MPDAHGSHRGQPGVAIGDALRALPMERPAASAWPGIATALANDRRRHRRPLWLAAAAVLLAALCMPVLLQDAQRQASPSVAAVADGGNPPAADAPALSDLMHESAQLEALLAATGDDGVGSGAALLLQARVRERLQRVDALLGSTAAEPAVQRLLWQERVVLLRQMAGIEGGEQLLAAHGNGAEGTLVMTF